MAGAMDVDEGSRVAAPPAAMQGPSVATGQRPKVRPIQMGEFLRKFARKRLLAIDKATIQAATLDMRQMGCGVAGGAEAIIHFRKAIMALWREGKLPGPICIIDIDQENFFGSLEWETIRAEVAAALPLRGAALAWKHEKPTKVRRQGAVPFEANRGTGQGDVDAPL